MNMISHVPEWQDADTAVLFAQEAQVHQLMIHKYIQNNKWNNFMDAMDENRNRPELIEHLFAPHLRHVVGGLITSRDAGSVFNITALFDIIQNDLPNLAKYIAPQQFDLMNKRLVQEASDAIGAAKYGIYKSLLSATRSQQNLQQLLTQEQMIYQLCRALDSEFSSCADSQETMNFLTGLRDHHKPVFEKLSAMAKGAPLALSQRLLDAGTPPPGTTARPLAL